MSAIPGAETPTSTQAHYTLCTVARLNAWSVASLSLEMSSLHPPSPALAEGAGGEQLS